MLLGIMVSAAFCSAFCVETNDGQSVINIKVAQTQGVPKTSSIEAIINGHQLTVTFLENLGNVQVEVTTATGGTVDLTDIWTPNCYNANIPNTGDYIVTITLPNGDEYYGEFEVTD
jgi:hypothetical protein